MELELNVEQERFRVGVREWLAKNVPSKDLQPITTEVGLAEHREWEHVLFDAGYAAVHWPKEYGGMGLDPLSTTIFNEEYVNAAAPERLNRLGLGLAGPTLIDQGNEEQQSRWLRNILTCNEIWCQGFSEPEAGSDLAGLKTKGEISGNALLVNGQKIWTSNAQNADWMFALVRTNREVAKHKGLSFVMIDMRDPGITVRPIRQMNHAEEFSEVFFSDVVVPLENVVGDLGDGWKVAMTTLGHERGSGLNTASHFLKLFKEVVRLIPPHRLSDQRIRHRIAQAYSDIDAYRYMTLRTTSQLAVGRAATAQSYMGKLWWSEMQLRIYEIALEVLGEEAILVDGQPGEPPRLRELYWRSRAALIFAGSNEIQRNIVAERALGLPKG